MRSLMFCCVLLLGLGINRVTFADIIYAVNEPIIELPFNFSCTNTRYLEPGTFVFRAGKTPFNNIEINFFQRPTLTGVTPPPLAFESTSIVFSAGVLTMRVKQKNNGVLIGELLLDTQAKKALWSMKNSSDPQGVEQVYKLDFCRGDF